MPDEPRTIGGRYRLIAQIGRGGMASVFLAEQLDLGGRRVAVKQLAALHGADPHASTRFLQESRITGNLNHPNIVTVHDFFEDDGVAYIVMEYLQHGSLLYRMGRMSLPQIAGVLEGILAALSHAGERGIVHRDLKPANVMVTDAGNVKVADFGVARALNEIGRLTATGMVVGTPAYMAPEQALGQDVTHRTDLYTVGVMAYEMLVGRVPFTSADSPMALLYKHATEPPPAPAGLQPDIDVELAEWLLWMLEKSPAARPGTAAEAWDSLEERIIRLCGPRWRRDARLQVGGDGPAGDRPLTPAPFPSTQLPSTDGHPPVPAADGAGRPGPAADGTVPPTPPAAPAAPPRTVPRRFAEEWASPGGDGPRRRGTRRTATLAGAAVVLVAAVAGVAVLSGGDDGDGAGTPAAPGTTAPAATTAPRTTPPTTAATPVTGPDPPAPAGVPALAGPPGAAVLADPEAALVRVLDEDGSPVGTVPHSTGPDVAAVAGGRVVVGDDGGVTWMTRDGLRPVDAVATDGSVTGLVRARTGTWALVRGADGGRVCRVAVGARPACTGRLAAPGALAADGVGLLVTDTERNTLSRLTGSGTALRPSRPYPLGGTPGRVVVIRGRAWVAVPGGVARVDLLGQGADAVTVVPLGGTPSDLAAAGPRLVAALPDQQAVAILPLGGGDVVTVPVGGRPTSILPRDAATVGVLVPGADRIAVVDVAVGRRGRDLRVPVGGDPRQPPVLRSVSSSTSGRTHTVTVEVAGGRLGERDLVAADIAIADGAAAVTVWQGGIRAGIRPRDVAGGARLGVAASYGRVALTLSAEPGEFASMDVRVAGDGRALEITLTEPAPPPPAPEPTVPGPAPEPAPDPPPPPDVTVPDG